jgi:hypothetical protein
VSAAKKYCESPENGLPDTEWPKSDGTTGTASFSVNLYGDEDAFESAVYCRRKGLRELGLPRAYYERVSDNKCG